MKYLKLLLVMTILSIITTSLHAQVVNIPGASKEHFLKTYKQATDVDWSNNVTNYTVKFKNNNVTCRAHYRLDGTWDYTETLQTVDQIPAKIKDSYSKSRFSDWKIESFTIVDNDNNKHLYRIEAHKGVQKEFIFYNKKGKEVKTSAKL